MSTMELATVARRAGLVVQATSARTVPVELEFRDDGRVPERRSAGTVTISYEQGEACSSADLTP